jgi:hypothetical protein
MTRSSKRAPIAISTSQFCIAMFDSNVPCIPSMPVNCGSVPGNAPSPISVLVQGKPRRRTSRVSCGAASFRITPPPA